MSPLPEALLRDAKAEIENPNYICSECGEPLYNNEMFLYKNLNMTGGLPIPKDGFYMCLNYVVGKFKCKYWRVPIPSFILKNFASIKESFNDLVDDNKDLRKEMAELKKAINT